MAINVRGPMLTCKHVLPHMIAAGGGSIGRPLFLFARNAASAFGGFGGRTYSRRDARAGTSRRRGRDLGGRRGGPAGVGAGLHAVSPVGGSAFARHIDRSAQERAAISLPGGCKNAYTTKITASVIRPAVRKKSAKGWWVIFCHAPKITIAAPIHTMMFTILSNLGFVPAIV